MNLENLNVVELNAHEMQNVDGGFLGQLIKEIAKVIVEEVIIHTIKNPETTVSGGVDTPLGHYGGARP